MGIESADLQMQHINREEKHTKLGTKSNTCLVFWEVKCFMHHLWQEVTMMKEMRREDSVEAETGMANNHFLVAWHYAQEAENKGMEDSEY